MRSLPLVALPLLLAACSSEGWRPGTGVGNPGSARTTLSRVIGLDADAASVTVVGLTATRCDGTEVQTDVAEVVDLLAPDPLELGGGDLCAVALQLEPPLRFRGTRHEGGSLSLDIPLERVVLTPTRALRVDGESYVLELGDGEWVEPDAPSEDLESIAALLRTRSSLFLDDDADGEIDEEERSEGPVADADDDRDDHDGDDPSGGESEKDRHEAGEEGDGDTESDEEESTSADSDHAKDDPHDPGGDEAEGEETGDTGTS